MTGTMSLRGSCLCTRVQFEVVEPTTAAANCHCEYCRRSSGAPFVTRMVIPNPRFAITTGTNHLKWYESSPGTERGFCIFCGSTLLFKSKNCGDEVHFTMSNLIDPPDRNPEYNCFSDRKAKWVQLDENLRNLPSTSKEMSHYQSIDPNPAKR